MVAKIDTSEAFADVNDLVWRIVLFGVVTLGVVVSLSVVLSRAITTPVRKLSEVAARISQGELTLRAEIGSKDEIGMLAEAFNSMTDSLAAAHDDLTEKLAGLTRAEAVFLRRSDARQRAVLAASLDPLIAVDSRGIVQSASDSVERVFGWKPDQLVGKNIKLLMPEPHRSRHDGHLANYQRTGKSNIVGITRELEAVRKDGSVFPCEVSVARVDLPNDDEPLFTGVIRDISERKQAQAEQIDRIRAEQERDHLREAVRSLERVLGVVGHELRTPLAGIRAIAEFLLAEEARDSADYDVFLRNMNDEVVRMAAMLNDLLEVARLNSGAAKWNWSRVRLAEAGEEALAAVRPLIDHDSVSLTLHVEPADLMMNGDADAIRRLLVNLLSNAHKHTSKGSIAVRISGQMSTGDDCVEIQVSDSGTGMSPEIAARLGEAFALNRGTVGSYIDGSGLGLAICKGIVAAHGGTVSVATALGRGTTVTVLLRADLPEPQVTDGSLQITSSVLK